MIIRQLPRESATRRSVLGDANDWGSLEHLTASLFDAVQAWGWANVGSKKIPRPEPHPRPGDKPSAVRTELSSKEIAARLRAQIRKGGEK